MTSRNEAASQAKVYSSSVSNAEAVYGNSAVDSSQRVTAQVAAFQAILTLTAAIGLGIWLAHRKNNKNGESEPQMLGTSTVQALSRLIYGVFQPSLIFCSVSKTLFHATRSGESGGLPLATLSIMPVMAILHIGWGYLAAHLMLRIARLRSPQDERDVVVCCTFGNAGPLPLVLAGSLFEEDAKPRLRADVAACISFYLMAWSPCFYTLCPRLLKLRQDGRLTASASASAFSDADDDDSSNSEKAAPGTAEPLPTPFSRDFWTPPVVGSALGVMVGCVPFLSRALVASDGVAAPLFSALHTFSLAYLPSVILVLAGSLSQQRDPPAANPPKAISTPPLRASSRSEEERPPRSAKKSLPPVSGRAVLCIALVRFVVLPLATTWLVRLWLGGTGPEVTRPVIPPVIRAQAVAAFVLVLESGMPSAQNTVVLLQLQRRADQASRLTRALTVLYALSLVPTTILLQHLLRSTDILVIDSIATSSSEL